MKKLMLVLILLISTNAFASELTVTQQGGWVKTANNKSQDTWQSNTRLEYPIWREFALGAEFNYQGRQYFDSVDDPKGAFGSLLGYGFMGDLIFRPKVVGNFSPYVIGGLGYFIWDFKENPFLQDNQVTVDVENSMAAKIGVGADIKIAPRWSLNLEFNYFTAQIDARAYDHDNSPWNVVHDDGNIGNETWNFLAGVKYEF